MYAGIGHPRRRNRSFDLQYRPIPADLAARAAADTKFMAYRGEATAREGCAPFDPRLQEKMKIRRIHIAVGGNHTSGACGE
jgi:hypothetical protein